MLKSGRYKKIFVNKGINLATGQRFKPNYRPDIVGIRHDGFIDGFEVPSDSDTIGNLIKRMWSVQSLLDHPGEWDIFPIKR